VNDREALDNIAQILRDANWKTDPGLLMNIASVVRATGRDVMNTSGGRP
jgi:hypothetical protein